MHQGIVALLARVRGPLYAKGMKSISRVPSLALVLLLPLAACDGNDEGEEEVGTSETETTADTSETETATETATDTTETSAELSHAADIQPIWDDNCVTGCHAPMGSAASVLVMQGDAYPNLVDVDSGQAIGKKLVAPGDSTNSYLIAKLEGNQIAAGGAGGTMPSGGMLDAATIQTIKDWIDAGAPQ